MRLLVVALALAVAACTDSAAPGDTPDAGDAAGCHFPSGRPCPPGKVCLGTAGNECNYVACTTRDGEPSLRGTALACGPAPIEPAPGGPFVCDPGVLDIVSDSGSFTPPQAPCPLGGLWTIEDGFWGRCVPASQCAPLACDPAYGDDGCPSFHRCDAGTCRVAASDAASRP
jgi:hypothetical protein